ncbi:MAG TPA: T9SS type A sorting domain-containing protein, partial [Candidatus Kapabacteria bacterium]|nr:T9SS type A sorting domain-containing protein [Candidatus Kapabacteria bacterium]
IYLAGNYQDTIAFGNIIIKTAGIQDAYIAKLTEGAESVDVEHPKEPAHFYPNPASTTIHILKKGNYTMTDILGREVKSCKECDQLSLESLPSGTYILNGISVIKY